MKVETYFYGFVALFLAVLSAVYWFASHEAGGTALLIFCTGMAALVSSFTFLQGQRMDPRPEDLPDAEISDGAGELGYFSPHSWWPLPVAFSAAVLMLGLVYGWFLFLIGAGGLFLSVGGLLYENYDRAH